MKAGDEVYVHGYVCGINNEMVLIRNNGGYFATVPDEVKEAELMDEKAVGYWAWDFISKKFMCPICGNRSDIYAEKQRCPGCGSLLALLHGDE